MKIDKKIDEEIKKLAEKIEEYASCIAKVNSDNIKIYEIEELEEKDVEITEFARKMIEEYNISLYSSPYLNILDSVIDLCKSTTIEEFLENLKKYAEDMKEWAKSEIDAFEDLYSEEAKKLAEVKESEKVYYFIWNIWNGSQFVGKAHITVYKQKRRLCDREYNVYLIELYDPSSGWSSRIVDEDHIDEFLQELKQKAKKYENEELSCKELLNEVYTLLSSS